jgi:hypothetical protein
MFLPKATAVGLLLAAEHDAESVKTFNLHFEQEGSKDQTSWVGTICQEE